MPDTKVLYLCAGGDKWRSGGLMAQVSGCYPCAMDTKTLFTNKYVNTVVLRLYCIERQQV